MKHLLLALTLFVSTQAHAIKWEIYGACSNKPVHQGDYQADLTHSVGAISIEIFDANKFPYVGAEEGINSLLNSPIGLEAIEVVSDTKMRAYGWCYTVNGQQPTEMPQFLNFDNQNDKLVWFYAYSNFENNKWGDYCIPAYHIKAAQFCAPKK
jgi:hypothetical protein